MVRAILVTLIILGLLLLSSPIQSVASDSVTYGYGYIGELR